MVDPNNSSSYFTGSGELRNSQMCDKIDPPLLHYGAARAAL